jgi:hypothetical protein
MILYNIELTIQPDIESDWLTWMTGVHVPDGLRTACFSSCRICKILEPNSNDPSYVLTYECESLERYYQYRDNFAPALQKEHSERYAGRFSASRRILEEVARLP